MLNAPRPVLVGADVHEDLGRVVKDIDCTVFLSHLKLEDRVERLPSRHLALSLCVEDVKAQCDALTPESRERLQNFSSQKEENHGTNVSLAHALRKTTQFLNQGLICLLNLKLPVIKPLTSTMSFPPASSRFLLDDFDEDDAVPAQADCSVPAFAENLDEKRPLVGTICSTGIESDPLSAVTETHCQSGETELEGHEHTVQLLEKGGDSTQLPAMLETKDTTTESCQQRKLLGLSAVADVQRNSSSL